MSYRKAVNPSKAGLGLASRQHRELACSNVNRRLLDRLFALSLLPTLFRPVCFQTLDGAVHCDPARDRPGVSAGGARNNE